MKQHWVFGSALVFVALVSCKAEKAAAPEAAATQHAHVHAHAETPPSEPAKAPKAQPVPAKHAIGEDHKMTLDEGDRCPVCGMLPSKHKDFAAGVRLKDGRSYHFCGNSCMLKTHFQTEQVLGEGSEIVDEVVIDYMSGKPLEAKAAFWVAGSDVIGPMGPALVALSSEADRETFIKRHGGTKRFTLPELTPEMFESMRKAAMAGRKAMDHGAMDHAGHDHGGHDHAGHDHAAPKPAEAPAGHEHHHAH